MNSFPCIICGKDLERVSDTYEAQPYDGVMCSTTGNYGSTVFDSISGDEVLQFNICDPCLLEAGTKGRVFHRRVARLIAAEDTGIIGSMPLDRPFTLWDGHSDGDSEIITLSIEEIERDQKRLDLHLSIDEIKLAQKGVEMIAEEHLRLQNSE